MVSLLLLAALIFPQGEVEAHVSVTPASVAVGDEVVVKITLDVIPGYHLYHPDQDPTVGIPVSAQLVGDGLTASGPLVALAKPKLHIEEIGTEKFIYKWMEGKAELEIPATVTGPNGKVSVTWQVCNDSICLPPETTEFDLTYQLTGGGAAEVGAAEATQSGEAGLSLTSDFWLQQAKVDFRDNRVTWEAWSETHEDGETTRLHLKIEVIPSWHIYHQDQDPEWGVPLSAKVEGYQTGPLTSLTAPIPKQEFYGKIEANYLFVEDTVEFLLPIELEPGFKGVLPLELNWQACDPSICDPAASTVLMIPVGGAVLDTSSGTGDSTNGSLDPGSDTGALSNSADLSLFAADEQSGMEDEGGALNINAGRVLKNKGLVGLLIAAMLAGLASLLTPCVYPMIPITVSYFTKRAEAGKGTPMGNASAYGLGIMVTFVGLGMGAAALLGPSGANQIASNPWVNLGIGILFVVLAFSLLGFYEIQPPKFLQNFASKTQGNQEAEGYFPVMLMAVAFSVTAFTCTVGFVGGLLALAATSGEWFSSLLAMAAYAFVFALPFVILALVPQKLNKLPTAGGWMNAVKVTFGFIELIAALKFLSNADMFPNLGLLPRWLIVVLTAICLLFMAAYMFGLYTTKGDYGQKPPRTGKRMAFGTLWAVAAVYVLTGLDGKPFKGDIEGYFPPLEYGAKPGFLMDKQDEATEALAADLAETDGHVGLLGLTWYGEWELAVEQAQKKNRLLFLDFTGITCINCRRMEGNIFPEVTATLERMERAHLYVDRHPSNAQLEIDVFRTAAQPYYAVVDPKAFVKTIAAARAYDEAVEPQEKIAAARAFEQSFQKSILTRVEGYSPDSEAFDKKLLGALEIGEMRGFAVEAPEAMP
jgi:thiol:disulfide interchange protein